MPIRAFTTPIRAFTMRRSWRSPSSDPRVHDRAEPAGLPLKGDKVGFFFDNLLPDSDGSGSASDRDFSTSSAGAFDLLEAIGRDCVGALQLLPEGEGPRRGDAKSQVTPLDNREVERRLLGRVSEPDRAARRR